ncbi:hypothetical protein E2C01_047502 [Portunus trituberculatus]|uniref:Uncharacterized protein n=1 Tax=Portunus trituberculatus TaxID=210409 RepID=A0A5B7G1A0_PORTR|nr:hypothetical protein [Portunus trituberculatus]
MIRAGISPGGRETHGGKGIVRYVQNHESHSPRGARGKTHVRELAALPGDARTVAESVRWSG